MNEFWLLIKPCAADCNLRCSYCFYLHRQRATPAHPRMSDETLEKLIAGYLGTRQPRSYTFNWQGGEPALLGLRFWRRVVELQKRHAPPGSTICNGFQTNATLITDELAAFLGEYQFLFGVSLDGPAQAHDHYRKTVDGRASHAAVLKGIERLKKHGVAFNVLALVNDRTVKQPAEIYGYLKNRGFTYQQYVPCVEFDEAGQPAPYSIPGPAWGAFLCEIFDRWMAEDRGRISIRLFDSIIAYLVTGQRNACAMGTDCREYFVVEYDGSVYPCDFFVRDELRLGNVRDTGWKELLASPLYRQFGLGKAAWSDECRACRHLSLCHGDCLKFRPGGGKRSILCEGWQAFYDHALPGFQRIADEMKANAPGENK